MRLCPSNEQVERLFQEIQSDDGVLSITVFNAGAFERREVVETDPADFERCWRIGCFAGFLVGKAAARVMLKKGKARSFLPVQPRPCGAVPVS